MSSVKINPWGEANISLATLVGSKVSGKNGSSRMSLPRSFKEALYGKDLSDPPSLNLGQTLVKGFPSILFSKEDIKILAEPFTFSMVGKFPLRQPNMDKIRNFFDL